MRASVSGSRLPTDSDEEQRPLIAPTGTLSASRVSRFKRAGWIQVLLTCLFLVSGCHTLKSMPAGTSFAVPEQAAHDVAFFADRTWVDQDGTRHVDQQVFNEMFRLIDEARQLIVLDMFLYNDWQGPVPETTRALSSELTDRLLAARARHTNIQIVVITDPVNTLYSGLDSAQFDALRASGIQVVETNLDRLRDSNVVYSPFWRLFFKPFGNGKGSLLPNPIGPGRVSLRTYMKLINFKANHRKTMIVDNGNSLVGYVSSANPHDGSSAHRNAAIRFSGPAAVDLLDTENAVLGLSDLEPVSLPSSIIIPDSSLKTSLSVQVVTEARIKDAILQSVNEAASGDRVDLMMFYLSDRQVVRALSDAQDRGARVRVILDPNKDAFGREKNGVPNRPIAHSLTRGDIDFRWCNSMGEQCHAKMILVTRSDASTTLISGSANFTRRNLNDFNLETDVVLRGPSSEPVLVSAQRYFDDMWRNESGRLYSTDYEAYRDESLWRRFLGWFMETSGISSF